MNKVGTMIEKREVIEWVQKSDEQIKTHPAWHADVSEAESETFLKNNGPFTYLLRAGDKEHFYFISFVKEDRSIKHQFFTLEFNRQGWLYRNGGTGTPEEIVSKELDLLIPMMMHCDLEACTPLIRT